MTKKKRRNHPLDNGFAIYLRTSDAEAQAPEKSQAGQRRVIEERILAASELPIIEIYADAYTGTSADRQNYQRMLTDARLGKFSHVAVAALDRFGRDIAEATRAIKELNELGIKVVTANAPDRDGKTAMGRFHMNLELSLAQLESERIGERTREAMITRYMNGEWPHLAPDGYINKEMKTSEAPASERLKYSRYKRWVELDPEQAKVIRFAFDLLLQDRLTLNDICEELHAQGFRLRNGRPFVKVEPDGTRITAKTTISAIFRNWFYAGWVVTKNEYCTIPPKQVRGKWEPIVTTEEFEKGLAVLAKRNKTRMPAAKQFYLLQGIVYLEEEMDETT